MFGLITVQYFTEDGKGNGMENGCF